MGFGGRCGVGVAAEVLVDDILVRAGAFLGGEESVRAGFVRGTCAGLTSAALAQSCGSQGHSMKLLASAEEMKGRRK